MRTGNRIHQCGYTFIGLLLVIMLAGLALAEAANTWSNLRQREREQELLKVGDKIRAAIGEYYNQSPGQVKQYPPTLEDLVRDKRYPAPKRYLRKIPVDPMTGMANWGTMEGQGGGIMGVMSLSAKQPFKQKNFPPIYKSFENKKFYADWVFAYTPANELLKQDASVLP